MKDTEKKIRAALAAGPTPGPWIFGPTFDNDGTPERLVNAFNAAVVAVTLEFGKNNPTFQDANAQLIAACNPVAMTQLLAELDALRRDGERLEWVMHRLSGKELRRITTSQPQQALTKEQTKCSDCKGTGIDGDVGDDGRAVDVTCGGCAGTGSFDAKYVDMADLGSLMRFHETCDDGEAYDIGKDACKRLSELGCLQSHGFGRYSITSFGDYVLAFEFGQHPRLPLKTVAEYNEASRLAAIQQPGQGGEGA